MNKNRAVVSGIILVVVLVLVGWFVTANDLLPMGKKSADTSKASGWHAVFLTNGQVYFGEFSDKSGQYSNLRNIYYLQLAQSPQPSDNKDTTAQPQISLVKLGNELHGPVDEMKINNDHILFVEEMKDSAKVVEAIKKYQTEGPTTQTTASPVPVATASASPAAR